MPTQLRSEQVQGLTEAYKDLEKLREEIKFLKAVIKFSTPNLDAMHEDWVKKTGYFSPRDL